MEGLSRTPRKRWMLLGLATLSQVSVAAIRLGVPAAMPFIREDLKLTHAQIGIVSSVLNGGAAAAGIPAGKAVDRIGERLILGYGTIASGIIIIAVNAVSSFTSFLPLLLLVGFMTTTTVPAGSKAVARWFSDKERAMAMGFRQAGIPLGGALAAVTLPAIAVAFGWRWALQMAGLFAVAIGLITLRLYEEPPVEKIDGRIEPRGTSRGLLFRNGFLAVLIYGFALSVAQWFYLTYITLYLTDALHFSLGLAANVLALGQLSGAVGRVFWGLVSDRLFQGRRKPALILVGFIAIVTTLSISNLVVESPVWLVVSLFTLLGLAVLGWNGLALTLAAELAENRVAGLAVGITNSTGFLGVILLTPALGFFVDWSGSYSYAWGGLIVLILIAVSSLAWVKENRPAK